MARPGLTKNIKFKVLVARLGLPRPYVLGLLEILWEWAHESGDPVLVRAQKGAAGAPECAEVVELAAEWPGERGVLFAALRDGRWIEEDDNGNWQIHDYFDHAPRYVKERARKELLRKRTSGKNRRKKAQALRPESESERSPPAPLPSPAPAPAPKSKSPAAAPRGELVEDDLFSAIAEVTGASPTVNADDIGKVRRTLLRFEPPMTPAEVRQFPAALAAAGYTIAPALNILEQKASWIRTPPARAQPPPNGRSAESFAAKLNSRTTTP